MRLAEPIEIKRDADYWEDQVTVRDQVGALVAFSDAEIIIHPDTNEGDPPIDNVVWSLDNLRLTNPSDGVFGFNVPLEEIAAYQWSGANFCWSVIYTNGFRDGSWMTGRVTVKDKCQ